MSIMKRLAQRYEQEKMRGYVSKETEEMIQEAALLLGSLDCDLKNAAGQQKE